MEEPAWVSSNLLYDCRSDVVVFEDVIFAVEIHVMISFIGRTTVTVRAP